MIHVVAAPAAYSLGDRAHGSEETLSYAIMEKLACNYDVRFTAMTLFTDWSTIPHSNLRIIRLSKRRPSYPYTMSDKLSFFVKYSLSAMKVLERERDAILHHMSPAFVIKGSFNPIPLLGLADKHPFIIGPVYPPGQVRNPEGTFSWARDSASVKVGALVSRIGASVISKTKLFEKTLEKCDVLVASSMRAQEAFSEFVDSKRIVRIPLGVDEKRFVPSERGGLDSDCIKVLVSGALLERKGFQYVLFAVRELTEKHERIKLQIVGDGPFRNTLVRLARRLRIDRQVIFRGFVPYCEIPKVYQSCDIFCHPTLSEIDYGRVVLENMACAKAVIATDVCGAAEAIENGWNGLTIPPGDTRAIVDAFMRLTDEASRKKLGENARKTISEKYSWDCVARGYYDIYQNCLRTAA